MSLYDCKRLYYACLTGSDLQPKTFFNRHQLPRAVPLPQPQHLHVLPFKVLRDLLINQPTGAENAADWSSPRANEGPTNVTSANQDSVPIEHV